MDLVATEFKNTVEGTSTFGFRLYDSYGKTYGNGSSVPIEGDLALLEYALTDMDEETKLAFDNIKEMQNGLNINGTWYDWDEIKDCF